MKRKDVLILLLHLPTGAQKQLMSPIQIMKSLFLFKMEMKLPDTDFYKFEPYLYGPCSFDVYLDLIELKNEGIIDTELSPWGWKYYRLTSKGEKVANEIIENTSKEVLNELKSIKKLVMSKNFIELLKYVYAKYPEYAKNSIINLEVVEK